MTSQRNLEDDERRITRVGAIGVGAILLAICLVAFSGYASAATLYAGTCGQNHYSTIQAAVDNAASGDTVLVCPGTYYEVVIVKQNITLEGVRQLRNGFPTIRYPPSSEQQCPGYADYFVGCPQIIVADATVKIASLRLEGSDYKLGCTSIPGGIPGGIAFDDASGNVQDNTIVDHDVQCDDTHTGYGIYEDQQDPGSFSISASNNLISNSSGIEVASNVAEDKNAQLVGELISNVISTSYSHSVGIFGIGDNTNLTIAGNQITAADSTDTGGISIEQGKNDLVVGNNVEGAAEGIDVELNNSSVVTYNTVSNASIFGIDLLCADDNWVTLNDISDVPTNTAASGVILYACSGSVTGGSNGNQIIGNAISGFCSGVLTGSPDNFGNTVSGNSFANIGPGTDIMAGDTCP
jgi:hypothetical protein